MFEMRLRGGMSLPLFKFSREKPLFQYVCREAA
jgi:hypothetical protein